MRKLSDFGRGISPDKIVKGILITTFFILALCIIVNMVGFRFTGFATIEEAHTTTLEMNSTYSTSTEVPLTLNIDIPDNMTFSNITAIRVSGIIIGNASIYITDGKGMYLVAKQSEGIEHITGMDVLEVPTETVPDTNSQTTTDSQTETTTDQNSENPTDSQNQTTTEGITPDTTTKDNNMQRATEEDNTSATNTDTFNETGNKTTVVNETVNITNTTENSTNNTSTINETSNETTPFNETINNNTGENNETENETQLLNETENKTTESNGTENITNTTENSTNNTSTINETTNETINVTLTETLLKDICLDSCDVKLNNTIRLVIDTGNGSVQINNISVSYTLAEKPLVNLTENLSEQFIEDNDTKNTLSAKLTKIRIKKLLKHIKNNKTTFDVDVIDKTSGNSVKIKGIKSANNLNDIEFIKNKKQKKGNVTTRNNASQNLATDIIYVDPLEISDATVTLQAYGNIEKILTCENYNPAQNYCSSWIDSGIPFTEDNGFVTFNVTHFSAYAGGGGNQSVIHIWDYTDNEIKYGNEQVNFYANFTNTTSNESVNGTDVYCQIRYNTTGSYGPYINMTFNVTSLLYTDNNTAANPGTYTYEVFCNGTSEGYEELDVIDDWTITQGCINLSTANTVLTLTNNVSINGSTCFAVTANNVTIDCAGYSITGNNTAGTYGVYSNGADNFVVQNCMITGFYKGIYIASGQYCIAQNNTINITISGGYGIHSVGSYSLMDKNTVYGLTTSVSGIYIDGSTSNATNNVITVLGSTSYGMVTNTNYLYIFNNTITSNGSSTIAMNPSGSYTTIENNTINAYTTGGSAQLELSGGSHNTLIGNTVSSKITGIALSYVSSSNIINNYVNSSSDALQITGAYNNNITGGSVTAGGGRAIYINSGAYNNNIRNITISSSSSAHIEITSDSYNNSIYWNNFTGTSTWINNANNTNSFNTSVAGKAQGNYYPSITSYAIYDSNSDGWGDTGNQYPISNATIPSKWTGYGEDYGPATTLVLGCANITVAGTIYTLYENISINGSTCFNVFANNVTIDCNGFGIVGDNSTGTYGIHSNSINTTVKNCVISGFNTGIYYNGSNNGLIENNYISTTANGGLGISLYNYANSNNVTNNTIITSGSSSYGIYISTYSEYDNISNNNVTGTGASTTGVYIYFGSTNNDLYNNSIKTTGSSSPGLILSIGVNSNTIISNTISSDQSYGIYYSYAVNYNTVIGGSIRGAEAIRIDTFSSHNIFYNMTLNATSKHIDLDFDCGNNTFYWNNITGTGIWVDNRNESNYFNTSVAGVPQGNFYPNITAYNIYDSNSDGWGDTGSQYPLSNTTIPSKWAWYGEDYGPATTKQSATPSINSISYMTPIDPLESSSRTVAFNFTVNDLDGNDTINVSSAKIIVNNSGVDRLSNSCSGIAINATAQNITCNVSMNYYDRAGIWNINISIKDVLENYVENITTDFTYNTLVAMSLNINLLNFSSAYAGQKNVSTEPVIISNTGNYNYSSLSIKAYDLSDGSILISANDFRANTSDNADGHTLVNDTFIDLANSSLDMTNDVTDVNRTVYIYVDIPNIPPGVYNSISEWIVRGN